MTFQPFAPLPALAITAVLVLALFGWAAFRDLKSPATSRGEKITWGRRAAILVLTLFVATGPSVLEERSEVAYINLDVYFVVDRTGSMAAEDYDGNKPRLTGVRNDMTTLMADLSGARFSIISFDSTASRQMPLTTDTRALSGWITNLNQEITYYSAGSSLDRVREELSMALRQGATRNPDNQRIVYLFTDGENTTDTERLSFAPLAQYVDGGAVLGYGTSDGGRMKTHDPSGYGNSKEYITDWNSGDPAISVADANEITALGNELGVPSILMDAPTDLSAYSDGFNPELITSEGRRLVTVPQLILWPFTAVIMGLLLWELTWQTRRAARKVG